MKGKKKRGLCGFNKIEEIQPEVVLIVRRVL